MNLSRRELSVLREVVETYIRSGHAVASAAVARRPSLGLSAATIRNVMSDLADSGLLSRGHSSAGCVPTDLGLRVFVDSVCVHHRLPPALKGRLARRIEALRRELVEDMEWVARVVAEATSEAGVAVRPMGEATLEAVSLIRFDDTRVLAILVTGGGVVERRLLSLGPEWDAARLVETANFLTESFSGTTFTAAREMLAHLGDDDNESELETGPWLKGVAEAGEQLFSDSVGEVEVLIAGAEQLMQSEDFSEVSRMRALVGALENHGGLVRELRRTFTERRTEVIIGHESEVTATGRLGVVATLFYREGRRMGAVGVVGPRRMDYRRIVPVVEFIGDTVTRTLEQPGARYA